MPRTSVARRSVDIDVPADVLFRFHLDPRNAPRVSPDALRFIAIEGTYPVTAGTRVTMRVHRPPLPVTHTWRLRVAEVEQDRRIVDVAERSPFAYWRHEHRFTPLPGGGTRMTDAVIYALPCGPLGRLADAVVVRRLLERILAGRQARTKALLERAGGPR